ncbi:VOC family protein [Pseudalkalibacillus hwajinpoensis]|uniref:VOC family protein n=1 Tax=Guptibacillus hwajinpoensis TaxID=208199 RepID=UPI001CFCBB7D|nr:VOC family protein [Pseudalkalibacillus hwajinpoensis]
MFERIDTFCLRVRNIEKSTQWYEDSLGLKVVFKGEGYRVLSVGSGSVPLTIEEGETNPHSNQSYPILYSKDIEETYKKLKDHDVHTGNIFHDGDNHYFDFFDPDDNKLQVCFFSE